MTILRIWDYRDIDDNGVLLLKERSEEIDLEKTDKAELRKLVWDLTQTMQHHKAFGMAAPQLGILKRIFVIDLKRVSGKNRVEVFINPRILAVDGYKESSEGCLSVSGYYATTKRHQQISLVYNDENKNQREQTFKGLMSVVVQHEVDHLNGITILDKEIKK